MEYICEHCLAEFSCDAEFWEDERILCDDCAVFDDPDFDEEDEYPDHAFQ